AYGVAPFTTPSGTIDVMLDRALVPGAGERLVTLVLCDSRGRLMGELPPFLARPLWWPEVDEVVRIVRERHGLEVMVLRLLTAGAGPAGGPVSYLAEVTAGMPDDTVPLSPEHRAATDSGPRNRRWWADPGGLDGLAGWVDSTLSRHGRRRTGPVRQRKTWNLSLVVSALTTEGEVWFKAVPPFLVDEGGVIARVGRVDPDLVPVVLGHDAERRAILMDQIPGADQWGLGGCAGDEEVIARMVTRWVAVQAALVDDIEHALVLGATDLRPAAMLDDVRDLAGRRSVRDTLTPEEGTMFDSLVSGLPDRLEAVAACGLPDTLVHGDLHPGNWRRAVTPVERLTLLDWGDVGVGNPVIDMRAFVERLPDDDLRRRTSRLWAEQWRRHVPGADPVRAAELLRPVAELGAALTYQRFLDHIEATEWIYHEGDPASRIRAACVVLEEER
ncbi:MAG: aminoglycoside phosphotransferase family protein, partial [Actinomycetota bacterium]|nr:aminoglycoside phosphotransferase family protein [Actinomycetota bacterium]